MLRSKKRKEITDYIQNITNDIAGLEHTLKQLEYKKQCLLKTYAELKTEEIAFNTKKKEDETKHRRYIKQILRQSEVKVVVETFHDACRSVKRIKRTECYVYIEDVIQPCKF